MAPRSARKRKGNEVDVSGSGRRKKREDTPMKTTLRGGGCGSEGGAVAASASSDGDASVSQALMLSTPEKSNTEELMNTQANELGTVLLPFDPEESQMTGTLDDTFSGEGMGDDELLPMVLETQYEDDEEQDGDAQANIEALDGMDEYREENAVNDEGDVDSPNGDAGSDVPHEAEYADDDGRDSLIGASASIEEILQQLADVASNFVRSYRELTLEGDAIQAELNELNEAQEERCTKILGRLERAGLSIYEMEQEPDSNEAEGLRSIQDEMSESQETAV